MSTTVLGLSEKQKAMRQTGLGASEVGTALGLNPFMSAAELAAVKRGELPPFEGNEFTHWGQKTEPLIAREFLERRVAKGEKVQIFTPPTIRHSLCANLFATCDRILVPEGRRAREAWLEVVEAKNVSEYRREAFEDDEVPEVYLVQVQVQLEVVGLDRGTLAALFGGNRYREFPIARDRELGGNLVEFSNKWWQDHVVQGLPVPVDGSDAASSYLKRRYPLDSGPLLDPTPELEKLVADVRAARATLNAAKECEATAANALKAALAEHAGVAGLCTYKLQKGSTYTVTREPGRVLRFPKEK